MTEAEIDAVIAAAFRRVGGATISGGWVMRFGRAVAEEAIRLAIPAPAESEPKAESADLSESEIDNLLYSIDYIAREKCSYEFGLPMHGDTLESMRGAVRAALAKGQSK